jgi:predicted transcriptional regulator
MIKNDFIHPIEIDTAMLMDGHVTANQAMLMEAIRLTCEKISFIIEGKPFCILNLADLCRVYNLKYINAHNAARGLIKKGYLEKSKDKLKITETWFDLLASYQ